MAQGVFEGPLVVPGGAGDGSKLDSAVEQGIVGAAIKPGLLVYHKCMGTVTADQTIIKEGPGPIGIHKQGESTLGNGENV